MRCLKISSRFDLPFNLAKYNPQCLISIKGIREKFPFIIKDFRGPKLLLSFDDILENNKALNTGDKTYPAENGPTKQHIFQLIKFAIDNKNKTFVINCKAGVSRSSAAAFILEVISDCCDAELVLRRLMFVNRYIYPNNRMLKIATKLTHVNFIGAFDKFKPELDKRFSERVGG